ncbi:MAG TPA: hypothetical protein VKV05_05440 [Terriglobales bacterium]|nr:hypothetical protein [Terriglobales bacterium]
MLSRGFIPDDRSGLLLEAAKAALSIDRAKAEAWASQLFTFSQASLEPGRYRLAMEKNALTIVAQVDPVRAARLFRQQDVPDVKDSPAEDVRTTAATVLFAELWSKRGRAALPQIQSLAAWLGSTGQYPYTAIASVIVDDLKSDPKTAALLFGDAITYFPRDPGYRTSNWGFTNLILRVAPVAPSSLLQQAITEDVAAIKRSQQSGGTARYQMKTANRTYTFDSEGKLLVYRLMPLLQQMDPDWAAQLANEFGLVRLPPVTAGEPVSIAGAVTPPDQQDPASNAALQAALNAHWLMQSQQQSVTDPSTAAQVAMQITDPVMRSVALVSTAPAYSALDAAKADDWVSAARQQLTDLPPSVNKLRLEIALAKVDIANGRRPEAQAEVARAYDFGGELFQEDVEANPGKFSEMADGFAELVDLTQTAARQPWLSPMTLAHIRELHNDVLRARLLVEQAKGMTESKGRG